MDNKEKPLTLQFSYFQNHGNEEGTDNFTIIFGDMDEDHIITGAEDTEENAQEAVKRLNGVLSQQTEALQADYNKLGVKFDKETERWQERDVEQREKIEALQKRLDELGSKVSVPNHKAIVESLQKEVERLKEALKELLHNSVNDKGFPQTATALQLRKAQKALHP